MLKVFIKDLGKKIDKHRIVGQLENVFFSNFRAIDQADEESLTWLKTGHESLLGDTKAKIIVVGEDFAIPAGVLGDKTFIVVANPRRTYAKIANMYLTDSSDWGIHPTAHVDVDAEIHPHAYVGPFCSVGRCCIGEGSRLIGHNFIYNDVVIGKNVTIHAGSVIGGDGFGYVQEDDGSWMKFPHIGGVIIEDDVEIGSNSSINRGALKDTIIKRGVKIDDHCFVAHNVVIDEDCIVTAGVVIAGSTSIGKNCWISPNATLNNALTVGDDAFVGIGSVVVRNIRSKVRVFGNPAKKIS